MSSKKCKVVFFNRNRSLGYSINKVFIPIRDNIARDYRVENVYVPGRTANPIDIIKNLLYVWKHRDKNAVNHVTGDIHYCMLALIGCKSVLTIHDIVVLKNAKNKVERFIKWFFWFYLPIKLSDQVVCISEQTKNDVLAQVDCDKILVIHNPIDDNFIYQPNAFNAVCPRILQIGTGWNKNLNRVIVALNGISCHLKIIGKLNEKQLELLNFYKIDYSCASNLTDQEIYEEYIQSDIVSFPSIFEGFGMPVIEGQAVGRAVLTSAIEPIIEISGEGAHFVNPENVESIKEGFNKLINLDTYRIELIGKGVLNARRFEAKYIAEQYSKVYSNLY